MSNNRSERLGMRVNPEDKKRWKQAASHQNSSLSMWIETVLNILSDQILGPRPPQAPKGQLQIGENEND